MNNKKISIIIKSNCDISAIASLLQQNNNSWECFIINNSIQNIDQFIANDNRFKILADIKEAINHSTGDYIMFIDSHDIMTNDSVDNILHAIQFTNSDIIKVGLNTSYEERPETTNIKCKIQYIFKKDVILDYVFNDISVFCFKKDMISTLDVTQSEHCLLNCALLKAKDMVLAQRACIIKQQHLDIPVEDIINNYEQNHQNTSELFWKKYFRKVTPQIISQTVKNNDKKSFITFCHKIPLRLIPLRYRIMCYILKKTNK